MRSGVQRPGHFLISHQFPPNPNKLSLVHAPPRSYAESIVSVDSPCDFSVDSFPHGSRSLIIAIACWRCMVSRENATPPVQLHRNIVTERYRFLLHRFSPELQLPSFRRSRTGHGTAPPPLGIQPVGRASDLSFIENEGFNYYRHLSCPSYCERNAPPIFGVVSRSMMNCSTTIGTLPPLFPSCFPAFRRRFPILRSRGGWMDRKLSELSSEHNPP